jgi:hypothetical protein
LEEKIMGSFNVAGTISNLSLSEGTRCIFIPLLPSNFVTKESALVTIGGESQFVSNDGAECFFAPFSLPIIGEYND